MGVGGVEAVVVKWLEKLRRGEKIRKMP